MMNQQYGIKEIVDSSSRHENTYEVYRQTYSPNYGWRNFELKGKFKSKQEAKTWIEENS